MGQRRTAAHGAGGRGGGERNVEASCRPQVRAAVYLLRGGECITWECSVADGYTVDLCAKVSVHRGRSEVTCVGKRVNLIGVDSSRVVCERERAAGFQGCLDLAGEHAGCLSGVGCSGGSSDRAAVLVLEIDNGFSYFTSKDVMLRVSKRRPVEGAVAGPGGEGAPPAVEALTAQDAPRCGGGLPRPNGWHPPTAAASPAGRAAGALGGEEDLEEGARVERLQALLAEALRLCPHSVGLPAPLHLAREHLRAAQAALGRHALLGRLREAEEDGASPLG